MNDTPPEILKKQFEIIKSKPEGVRYAMQMEMMDYAANQTKALIRKKNPHLSEREVVIEFVKLYYKDDFSEEEMLRIVEWMKNNPPAK
jgi:hypothetical protein